MTVFVLGHRCPDADSVCSAIALSALHRQCGIYSEPAVQGQINLETRFLLEQAGVEEPQLMTDVADKSIWLVDFSDREQGPDNLDQSKLLGIVDHHKLGTITTREPLECWIRPVGSTCTIVYNLYQHHGKQPEPAIAMLMLGAIISDTLHFRSPTCTDKDREAVAALQPLAGIEDLDAFVLLQFNAKANIGGVSPSDLLARDYKQFNMNGFALGIGQLELTDLRAIRERHEELLDVMRKTARNSGLHTCALVITDIVRENSEMLVASHDPQMIADAYGVELQNDYLLTLEGVVSRKKQVIPPLEKYFATQEA